MICFSQTTVDLAPLHAYHGTVIILYHCTVRSAKPGWSHVGFSPSKLPLTRNDDIVTVQTDLGATVFHDELDVFITLGVLYLKLALHKGGRCLD